MTDQVKTHFAGPSSGDEETNLLKIVASLDSAQKVLEQHAHIDVKGVSIRGAFSFLSARARSLPFVQQNSTTGAFEFKSEGEDLHEKIMQNGEIDNFYRNWQPQTPDSFRDILIERLIHSYSKYPEMIDALKTIRDSLVYEKALKKFYRNNFDPYQIKLMKDEFKQKCLEKQKPDSAADPTSEIT